MKTTITLSIVLFMFNLSSTAQDCSTGRYLSEVFSTVDVTSDIQYGSNFSLTGASQNLLLDVYQPQGDTLLMRPLIIWIHGGSFLFGDKLETDVVPLAQDFAKMGYVTASIDYRLGMENLFTGPDSVDATETVIRAVHDARAAVRFFKKDFAENCNTYRIDTNNIFVGGVSAGGIIAVHLAYLDKESEMPSYVDTTQVGLGGGIEGLTGNSGYKSNVRAIISSSGALRDTSWMEGFDDTPIISFHGDADGTVPYGTDIIYVQSVFPIMLIDGSSSIHERAENLGMTHCFESWPGQDHVPHVGSAAYYDTLVTMSSNFLFEFVCGVSPTCSYTPNTGLGVGASIAAVTTPGNCEGTATAIAFNGTPPYVYLWDDLGAQSTQTATGLCVGSYSVIIVDDTGDSSQTMVIISSCGAVSTPELIKDGTVSVYPNPAATYARFVIENNEAYNTIFQMYDTYGRKIRGDHKIHGSSFIVQREGLPSGIYHIRFIGDGEAYTAKLIFK